MPKAVFDANILISAFLRQKGVAAKLIREAEGKNLALFSCQEIILETAKALLTYERIRRKYNYSTADAEFYLTSLEEAFQVVILPSILPRVCRDPNDNMVLACAFGAEADYVVTRDKDLLVLGKYKNIKILTPEQFIKI